MPVQPGRTERCERCSADLRVCLNCVSYDTHAAYQCRDRRADPVGEKDTGNFCEYFEFARRVYVANPVQNSREEQARSALKKLLGD
jgi:hypothetical protein